MTKPNEHDAHTAALARRAEEERLQFMLRYQPLPERKQAYEVQIGCSSACADGGDCNCSHAMAWRAPRQPRRPEPRKPTLSIWTRLRLFWTRLRASF